MIAHTLFTLDNGLRVVHHHVATTAMVAVNVLYNVGARDESPSHTGLAHLFEHLMFGGSVNIPHFDREIERAGGVNNAWTSDDFTNFWDIAPAVNAETLFWLESDRMLSLAFSPESLRVQRDVVIEEFKQVCLNRPYGDLSHVLRSLLYTRHPYRVPTIGLEPAHIASVTPDMVKDFFYTHYAPNNAVLAVSGNITLGETRRLAEKWFGPIPRREIAPRAYAPEPPITSPRSAVVSGRVPQTMVVIAFPMAAYGQPGYIAADLITDILANGHASRMYRGLVMDGTLFSDADASIAGTEEPGYLMLIGRLLRNGPEAEAEALEALRRQTREICRGVSDHELQRALNRFESNQAFSNMGYLPKATALAMAVMHGEDINETVTRYRATTVADIAATADIIFNPSSEVSVIYRPAQI